jgi:hypothetical protein
MGKKKAFIDKKKSVTYSLVYRDPSDVPDEDAGQDGGQRVLAPAGGHRGGRPASDEYEDYNEEDGSVYDSEYSLMMSRYVNPLLSADDTASVKQPRRTPQRNTLIRGKGWAATFPSPPVVPVRTASTALAAVRQERRRAPRRVVHPHRGAPTGAAGTGLPG